MTAPVVLLTQPRGGPTVHAAARDSWWQAHRLGDPSVGVLRYSPSQATGQQTHNDCWATMLNERAAHGLTHFAMIHADIGAEPLWLDTLLAEMERVGADVISSIVALKDERGLSSTAIDFPENIWGPRRISMTEAHEKYPVTWTDPNLVLNTGLWVAKVVDADGRPAAWCEHVAFQIHHRIILHLENGQYSQQMISEDWDFSRQMRSLGVTLFATRAVEIEHERPEWHNRAPWGTWKTDTACAEVAKRQWEATAQ